VSYDLIKRFEKISYRLSVKGRVCIPLDASRVELFDPLSAPTVAQLIQELEAAQQSERRRAKQESQAMEVDSEESKMNVKRRGEEKEDETVWEKTSLRESVHLFERFIEGILKDEKEEVKVRRVKHGEIWCLDNGWTWS
jgi:hypothetical protein